MWLAQLMHDGVQDVGVYARFLKIRKTLFKHVLAFNIVTVIFDILTKPVKLRLLYSGSFLHWVRASATIACGFFTSAPKIACYFHFGILCTLVFESRMILIIRYANFVCLSSEYFFFA